MNSGENQKKKNGEYFLGLDIGTDSVGYAVTDERYRLKKYKGEPMWGSHLFDAASQCAARRGFRTARRRLDRRQQRVQLVDEIFAPEVTKIDPGFYIRKKESALYAEDRTDKENLNLYFNSKEYKDTDFHSEYPTIHHLLLALMKEDKKFDLRLINIAIDWLVAHRGHFLSDVGTENLDKVMDFHTIYDEFLLSFENGGFEPPWDTVDADDFGSILKQKGISYKKTAFRDLLYAGAFPDTAYFMDRKEFVNFLAGGKISLSKLFPDDEFEDELKICISDDMEETLPKCGDYADIIAKAAAMYDWSVLSDILSTHSSISEAKVHVYEQHKKDLKNLKAFVRKYAPKKYFDIFRASGKDLTNYTAYSYNLKSVKNGSELPKKKATREDFLPYLKKTLNLDKIQCDTDDQLFLKDMIDRIANGSFLPKQVNSDNRVIPYQLYYKELQVILEKVSKYYPFLKEKDSNGYYNNEKLLSILKFKIPYYVGPLRNDKNSPFAWVVRKADGKIFPWNFDEKVDLDRSENAFISRMTNTCTYLPGEYVLPKWSLQYCKFTVLNEINNLKVNGTGITVEIKQKVFNSLFCKNVRVTAEKIKRFLVTDKQIQKDDELSGIDIQINSSLKSRYDFRNLLDRKILSEDDVERIISRNTYAEDKGRFMAWLRREYSQLTPEDLKYIGRLKYTDFGRLSGKFLSGLVGASKETGEVGTILHFLWVTNDNLNQLLSDRYTFAEQISEIKKEYYAEHKLSINQQMEDLGLSNAVKRPVTRTLAVVKDVVSTVGYAPKKIFVEMARGEDEKKQRTVTRKEQILNWYRKAEEDTRELEKQLEDMGDTANNRLQSDALFLYYIQLGKCMYTEEPIDLSLIKTDKYNIDHIYPQSLVKDDSLLNNRVLVLSTANADKGDKYPIDASIRQSRHAFWKKLYDNDLITKEKYDRLIRSTHFSENEKLGFINRQLVETRQSMKAVTQLLNNLYPESEIVYVKARLSADFKQVFKLPPKSRIINDLHHAKDAYLNIVVGNVYHERFTKKWFNINDNYSMKTEKIFGKDIVHDKTIVWDSKKDLGVVKNFYSKNNIHLTRYAYCKKSGQNGGFFDQNPVKKGNGQLDKKIKLDKNKYGGYDNLTACFFIVTKYKKGNKNEVTFFPVDLLYRDLFLSDEQFAIQHVQNKLNEASKRYKIESVEFPLGMRIVKIKSVLSLDGYRLWINGKANNGTRITLSSAESAVFSEKDTQYIRRIELFLEKKKSNSNLIHDSFDGLSESDNSELFKTIQQKVSNSIFVKLPNMPLDSIMMGTELFDKLSFEEQLNILINCIQLIKSGRTGTCDMKLLGGSKQSGSVYINASLSSNHKYKEILLIDYSPAGLHKTTSINLMELLK